MRWQRTAHRLATDERLDVRAVRIGLRHCCGILGGLNFQLLELKLHLVDQLAAAFGGGSVLVVPEFGDHQLEMCHHRLGTRGTSLRFATCHLFCGERGAQGVDIIRADVRCRRHSNDGNHKRPLSCTTNLPGVGKLSRQPAISGRHVRCGCRQSIPSSI